MDKEKILRAGKIGAEVREFARNFIKKDMKLLDIAEKIEAKIIELGGKPAFPTNLSIDEVAAHYTPSYDDEGVAKGLLKVDLGVHVDGAISDTAFSIDLENSEENKKLIFASEKALQNVLDKVNKDSYLGEIGKIISDTIEEEGFSPIINLSGHSIEEFELHSGMTIPNSDNGNVTPIGEGIRAIEPFATLGVGKVYDGKPSGIFQLKDTKNVRSPAAREVLDFILDEHSSLPFCSRWIVNKFGIKGKIGLMALKQNGNLHEFDQLVEASKKKVSQAEHTVLIEKDSVTVTTK